MCTRRMRSLRYIRTNQLLFITLICLSFCTHVNTATKKPQQTVSCPVGDGICEKDRLGYEAIVYVHGKLDDDHDGNVDLSESDEFIRDELQYTDGKSRHNSFHGNDKQISVDDLWRQWRQSEVYNWTVDDVIEWLTYNVDLPQYTDNFRVNAVDGTVLPRLAANSNHYLSGIIGIKNAVMKRKLNLKAMDVVLFGAPKKRHNFYKDVALLISVIVACAGCWYAYVQQKLSQSHVKKMVSDMDNLQAAEDALSDLQTKLDLAQQEQRRTEEEKEKLESKTKEEIQTAKEESEKLKLTRDNTETEINRLRLAEEELLQVRSSLKKAEKELDRRSLNLPGELQQWLQLTYEIEIVHYNTKKANAEKQLHSAKDACERLRKKRQAFMGSFRITHGSTADDIDQVIMNARSALEEVRSDLQERLHRWQRIEQLCGCNILNNPGLASLVDHLLEGHISGSMGHGAGAPENNNHSMPGKPLNIDDGSDDELPPIYHASLYNWAQHSGQHRKQGNMSQSRSMPVFQPSHNDVHGAIAAKRSHSSREETSSIHSEDSSNVKFHLNESEKSSTAESKQGIERPGEQPRKEHLFGESLSYDRGLFLKTNKLTSSHSELSTEPINELTRTQSDATNDVQKMKKLAAFRRANAISTVQEGNNSSSNTDDNQDGEKKVHKKKTKLPRPSFLKKDVDKLKSS